MPHQILYKPESNSPNTPYHLIFFITGNPGLIGYYSTFLSTLNHQLSLPTKTGSTDTYHIFGQSLAGFETGPSNPHPKIPFSLEEQVQFVHDTLLSQIHGSTSYENVILIGHSVGSYILLEILSRLSLSSPTKPLPILSGILLFPTVTHISRSPSGTKLAPLMYIPHFPLLATFTAKALLYCVPHAILNTLVKKITGMPPEAAKVTQEFLTSKSGILQALHLARDELRTITEDKWDKEIWGVEHSEASSPFDSPPKLVFYFGENDHWVADHTRDALIAARGSEINTPTSSTFSLSSSNNKPIMMIDKEGIEHGFCIHHSETMAEKVEGWIREIVGVS